MGFASLYPSYGCSQGVIPASAGMTIRGEPSSGPAAARPGRITPGGSRPCGSGHGRSHTRYGSGAKVPGDARALGVQRLRHAFAVAGQVLADPRSEEHTSELQSLMRISYAVFCLKKKKTHHIIPTKS